MKTIKEVADLCGYSKTSVNRAIKELEIKVVQSGNKNLVSDTDADRIVALLRGYGLNCEEIKTNQSKTETETEQNKTNPSVSISSVNSESEKNNSQLIDFLMEQIKVKDSQIQNLQNENTLLIQAQAYTLKQLEDLKKIETIVEESKKEPIQNESEPEEPKEEPKKKSWFPFKVVRK